MNFVRLSFEHDFKNGDRWLVLTVPLTVDDTTSNTQCYFKNSNKSNRIDCPHTFGRILILKAFPSHSHSHSFFSLLCSNSLFPNVHEVCISWGHTGYISGSVMLWRVSRVAHSDVTSHAKTHTDTYKPTNGNMHVCGCTSTLENSSLGNIRVFFLEGQTLQLFMQTSTQQEATAPKKKDKKRYTEIYPLQYFDYLSSNESKDYRKAILFIPHRFTTDKTQYV